MATGGVCEHCSISMHPGETVSRDGYSYHKKCHKCYVCSETNLHDAEVFRGVLFCGGCSKRIFRGCATARVAKPARAQHRAQVRLRRNIENSVLERARAASSSVDSLGESKVNTQAPRAPIRHDCYCVSDVVAQARRLVNFVYHQSLHHGKIENTDTIPEIDPSNTEACQRMLEALSLPVTTPYVPVHPQVKHKRPAWMVKTSTSDLSSAGAPPRRKRSAKVKGKVKVKKEVPCSDLRIAELGASTEIASMALRKTSTKQVKSEFKMPREEEITTFSMFSNLESGVSYKPRYLMDMMDIDIQSELLQIIRQSVSSQNLKLDVKREVLEIKLVYLFISHTSHEEFLDSECEEYRGSKESDRGILDYTIASVFKMPYTYFKKKILQRSSLISVIAGIDSDKGSVYKRIKMLFHEDNLNHRRNGYKKLYPTINKRKTYKLGWLESEQSGDHKPSPCKHFHECDSYRCMREQVMRLAGPTKSKIDVIKCNIKKLLVPWFWQNVSIQFKHRPALKSTACGKSASGVVSIKFNPTPGEVHSLSAKRSVPTAK